jgi:SNF family Na+-dependent transporter
MLPLGGMLITIFAVWLMPKDMVNRQLGISSPLVSWAWRIVAGVLAPLGVLAIFIFTVWPLVQSLFGL